MKLGRKLVALVTVFLMVFSSMPMMTANAADSDYPYEYTGTTGTGLDIYGKYDGDHDAWDTHQLKVRKDGVNYAVFCADIARNTSSGYSYRRESLTDNRVRAILAYSTGDYSAAQIIAAKQAAIWHWTNNFTLEDFTVERWLLPDIHYNNDAGVKALYATLITLSSGAVGDTPNAAVTVQYKRIVSYNADYTKVRLEFDVTSTHDLSSPVFTPSSGSIVGSPSITAGTTTVTIDNVNPSGTFTLGISGTQSIYHDACYYNGRHSSYQDLVGLPYSTTRTATGSGSIGFGSIKVTKSVGSEAVRPGDSFTFKLYQGATASGTPVQTRTINSATFFTFGGLPHGQYTLTEESAGSFNGTPVFSGNISGGVITVGATQKNVTCTNSRLYGSIVVNKSLGTETARAGDSFIFRLYAGTSASGTPVRTETRTGAGSFTWSGLEYGQYTLTEESVGSFNGAPVFSGDINTSGVVTVGGTQQSVTCTNSRLYGGIRITKSLGDETARAGDSFVFRLYAGTSATGTPVRTHTSTGGETFEFTGLEYGQYTLTEQSIGSFNGVPVFSGDISGSIITVSGAVKEVTVTNSRLYGSVTVTKTVLSGTAKAGDVFTFELRLGTAVIQTKTITAPATTCTFSGLEYGDYTVFELPAFGYTISPAFAAGMPVTVDSALESVSCDNTKLYGSLTVTKSVIDGPAKDGDMFTFELRQGATVVQTQTITAPATTCTFSGLEYGGYTLYELPVFGYALDAAFVSGVPVTVDSALESASCQNTKLYGDITITKTVADGPAKAGDVFTFELRRGTAVIATQTITAPETTCTFGHLEYGNYTVYELPAYGYALDTDFVAGVPVTVNSALESAACDNTKLYGSLTVTKALAGGVADGKAQFIFFLTKGGVALSSAAIHAGESFTFNHLEYGDYTISEAPSMGFSGTPVFSGDLKVDTTDVIAIDSTANRGITCTNTKLFGGIAVDKTLNRAAGDTTAIPAFTVEIVGPTGNPNADSKTQQYTITPGANTIGNLEYGNYTINEVALPYGYAMSAISATSFTVDGNPENDIAIAITNEKRYGAIEVTKGFTGTAPAAGTEFQFKLMEGDTQIGATQTLTWGSGGNKVTFAAPAYLLEYGHTYKVVEESLFGYNIDSRFISGYEVTITSDTPVALDCTNEKLFGMIIVHKAVTGGTPAAGQVFTFDLLKNGAVINTKTITWPATMCSFGDLEYGDYTVREQDVFGFTRDAGFITGKAVHLASGVENITCTNEMLFGDITVTKSVLMGSAHDGDVFTFGLYRNGALVQELTITAPATTCTFSHQPYGSYTIRESDIDGYLTDAEFVDKAVLLDSTSAGVTCANTKLYGSIEVTKKLNYEYVPAIGETFTFQVYDVETGTQVGADKVLTWSAGVNAVMFGYPDYPLLYNHSYRVVELPKPGYSIDPAFAAGQTVTISGETHDIRLDCWNTKLGTLTLTKAMEGDYVGAYPFEFTVSGPEGFTPQTFTLVPDDSITLENLPYGAYEITETVPDGYELVGFTGGTSGALPAPAISEGTASEAYPVNVDQANLTPSVVCTNRQLGKLQLIKKDAVSPALYLGGAVFQVTSVADPTLSFTLTTSSVAGDTLGKITSDWLPQGDYTVEEITAPAGYHIDDSTPRTLTVTAGVTAASTFLDSLGSVLIYKHSSYGDRLPLAGVIFQLLTSEPAADGSVSDGDIVGTATTGDNGYAEFTGLPIGNDYWVREIQQAPNYDIDRLLNFKVTASYMPEVADAVFANNPLGTVQLTKTDAADSAKKLAGAVYGVYSDADCTVLKETLAPTGSDGIATSSALAFGGDIPSTFYVKEITPPDGYLLNTTAQSVTFTEAGQVVYLVFGNTRNLGSLIIRKVDALDTTKTLAGAEFKIYTDDTLTTQVGSAATSGGDGIVRFDGLTPGEYWLVETVAPTDYDLLTEGLPMVVTAGVTEPDPIEIQNQYNPPQDITTGMMDWNILLIGGLALLAGLLLMVFSRRRRMQTNAR